MRLYIYLERSRHTIRHGIELDLVFPGLHGVVMSLLGAFVARYHATRERLRERPGTEPDRASQIMNDTPTRVLTSLSHLEIDVKPIALCLSRDRGCAIYDSA